MSFRDLPGFRLQSFCPIHKFNGGVSHYETRFKIKLDRNNVAAQLRQVRAACDSSEKVFYHLISVAGEYIVGLVKEDIKPAVSRHDDDAMMKLMQSRQRAKIVNDRPIGFDTVKSEQDSPLEEKARNVRRYWYLRLPDRDKDNIIKPAFEAANPTHEDKIKRRKEYEDLSK